MMKLLCAMVLCTTACLAAAQAEPYPSRPIRVVVPFGPGSGADIHGRFYADMLGKALKATVYLENKPGASGSIGMQSIKSAPADGYSIAVVSPSLVVAPIMTRNAGYKVDEFQPIAGIAKGAIGFFVRADSRHTSLNDMLAEARKDRQALNIGTYAGSYQIGAAWLSMLSGAKLANIPYRGASQAVTDMLGGNLDLLSADFNAMNSLVREGKLRALAVAAGSRLPELPGVPTVKETYAEYENYIWIGLVVRTGTPAPVMERLARAMKTVMDSKESQEHLSRLGWQPMGLDAAGMQRFIAAESRRYESVAQATGIQPE